MTWAMSSRSGFVIAILRNSFFRLSGRLERPAYPGFMVMNILNSDTTSACLLQRREVPNVPGMRIDPQCLANELNFCMGVRRRRAKTLLDALYLLRDCAENSFFESIRLVETAPSADLTETDKDAPHGLKVEGLVTAEDENEPTQGDTERFDRLRLACRR